MPRASLVITSYEQKAYLAEAVESALAQTRPFDEIVIVDDGSRDGSSELIRGYAAREQGRVTSVQLPHSGSIPRVRRAGLEKTTGDLVSILDGDDRLRPGFLAAFLDALEQLPGAGVAYSNVAFIDAAGAPLHLRDAAPQPSGPALAHVAAGAMGLLRGLLARRDLVARAGGLDERFPKYDGFVLTLRLAALTPFAYLFEPLVEYRVHPAGDSHSFGAAAHLRYLEEVRDEVERVIADRPEVERQNVQAAWRHRLLVHGVEADIEAGGVFAPWPRLLAAAARDPRTLPGVLRAWRGAARPRR